MSSIVKNRIAQLGSVGRCCLLALALALALGVAMPIAYRLSGVAGLVAAIAAAAVVWSASALGIVIGELFSGPNDAFMSLLFSMMMRMLLPLGACALMVFTGGPLLTAGFVYLVLGFYLAALPVDTFFSVVKLEQKSA